MIRELTSLEGLEDFIEKLNADPDYSEPMLSTPEQIACNLTAAVKKPDNRVLGVYRAGELAGLFVFLILEEERYLEMIVGLSRDPAAYDEILAWLAAHWPGYQADFVFNPGNGLLKERLTDRGASFCPEQQKMVFAGPMPPVDCTGIEPLSPERLPQYLAMHGTDVYWTGEKVAAAPERFRVLLAVDAGRVVGYLDVTRCFEENEPYDLLVLEEYRRRGWGRRLLAKALELNRPSGMMLLVDADNVPALALYESMGFAKVLGQNNLTVTWEIPEQSAPPRREGGAL